MVIIAKEAIYAMIERGDMPLSDLAQRLGVNVTTVWRWAKEAGIDPAMALQAAYDKRFDMAVKNRRAVAGNRWKQSGSLRKVDPDELIGLALRCSHCGHATSIKVKSKDYWSVGFHARLKCSKCGHSHDSRRAPSASGP